MDGGEIDLSVGFVKKFDKIIAVAVHGNEFTAGLAGLQFKSLGGTTTVDIYRRVHQFPRKRPDLRVR